MLLYLLSSKEGGVLPSILIALKPFLLAEFAATAPGESSL